MTGKTHLAFGVLVGTMHALNTTTDLGQTAALIGTTALFSLFPDICHTRSIMGRKLFPISAIIRIFFGHRTLTHSLIFIGITVVMLLLLHIQWPYLVAAAMGMLSHIVLDMLTKQGVTLFFPIEKKISFPITFKTGGVFDLSLATTFSILTGYIIYMELFHRIMQLFT